MTVDLRIAGGTVVTAAGRLRTDVLVDGGRITGLVAPGTGDDAGRVADATEKLVLPGMIDVHVHTREPGFEHKEDIRTTTEQAAAGGVTTIFGMPNLDPPVAALVAEEVRRNGVDLRLDVRLQELRRK
ncbi:MAG: amidohydrolase family protein, partial [Actinophytocola sp.]|nr:amidohydrolase family protein [Actinophytocola sp.]